MTYIAYRGIGVSALGVVLMIIYNLARPACIRGEVVPGADGEIHDDGSVRNP
jgi:hypothetical protein